jgi:hypothetical protein
MDLDSANISPVRMRFNGHRSEVVLIADNSQSGESDAHQWQ